MITTTSSATSAADSTSTVPRFFALPNLSSQEVSRVDPVAFDEKPRKDTKASHTAYATSPDTKDCFLSFYQGQLEGVRVSNSNPAIFLHGLLADYEAPLTQEQRLRCVDKCKVKPTFVSESYSGGTHAFWLFEAPVPLLGTSNTHEFWPSPSVNWLLIAHLSSSTKPHSSTRLSTSTGVGSGHPPGPLRYPWSG